MQCIASIEGYFLFVNRAFSDTLGWTVEELLDKPYLYFVHPDDLESTKQAMSTLAIGEKVFSFKNRYQHKNGSWLKLWWRALVAPEGYVYATARDVTAQQEYEDALLKSQESLSVMLQSIGDGVIATGNDGKVTLLNGVAQEMTGWSAAEAVGRPISEVFRIVHEHSREPAEIPVQRVLRTGQVQGLASHTVLISLNGEEWHIADSASPIRANDGRIFGVIMVFQDETARRHAIRTQEHLAFLVKGSNDAIVSETLDGIVLSWNPAAEVMFGYSAQEALGRAMEFRIPPDRWAEARVLQEKSAAGEGIQNFETFRLRRDGSRFEVALTFSPIRDGAGVIVGTSKILRDITVAKRAEAELGRERRLIEAISETVVNGILTLDCLFVTDEAGTILRVNQATLNQFGYSIEGIIGKNFTSLVPAMIQGALDEVSKSPRQPGFVDLIGTWHEAVGARSDHSEFPVELSVGETRFEDASIFTVIVRDITERKVAEDLLLRARKEAEGSNAAKSEFLSHMSHELRTPLNAVLGHAQLLQLESADSKVQDSSKSIIRAGRHLLQLINEVLDLSRIESGVFGISLEPVNLLNLIDDCIELILPAANESAIVVEIVSRIARDHFVMADKQRIKQVFLNLLSNAIKYNRYGGRVEIGVTEGNALSVIHVSDTGKGIDRSQIEKLFTPFERLGEQTVEGTGLGLSLSRNLVNLMGGQLRLRETSDSGSTFEVKLKLAPSETPETTELRATNQIGVRSSDVQIRILYIEDNPSNIHLMERIMKSTPGVELIVATLARTGLELARTRMPDLVLLDLHLPDADGARVLGQLKADPQTSRIPVIIISADATNKQIERVMQGGAKTYLTKPLELNALIAEINDVKSRKSDQSHKSSD